MGVFASLAKCIIFASAGSLIGVIGVAIVGQVKAQKKVGKVLSKGSEIAAYASSIAFQFVNAVATVAASWYGPVSISVPISHGTNMLVSMIVFGVILRLEDIDEKRRMGSYVATGAVILLPIVGPRAQNNQDLSNLLLKPSSLLWIALLGFGMILAIAGLAYSTKKKQKNYMFSFNLVLQCTAGPLVTTFSKMLDLVRGTSLYITIFVCLFLGLVMLTAIIQQAKLPQSVFVPRKTAVTIIVNGLTGIIIWEDWRVVYSWVGYATVLAGLIYANYVISDFDVFNVKTVQKCLKDCGLSISTIDSDDKLKARKTLDTASTQSTSLTERDFSIESEQGSHEIVDSIGKKKQLTDKVLEDFDGTTNVQVLDDTTENHVSIPIGTIVIDTNLDMDDRSSVDLEEGLPPIVGSWK